jgi:hypothetical protein
LLPLLCAQATLVLGLDAEHHTRGFTQANAPELSRCGRFSEMIPRDAKISTADPVAGLSQACALGIRENLEGYRQLAGQTKRRAISSIAAGMLSTIHRDVPEGCVMAALGPDLSRANLSTRQEVTRGIKNILDWFSELIPGKSKTRGREKAVATYATIVGALLLARAVDDPKLSEEILKTARASTTANA